MSLCAVRARCLCAVWTQRCKLALQQCCVVGSVEEKKASEAVSCVVVRVRGADRERETDEGAAGVDTDTQGTESHHDGDS